MNPFRPHLLPTDVFFPMSGWSVLLLCSVIAVSTNVASTAGGPPVNQPNDPAAELHALLTTFFQTDEAAERDELIFEIEKASDGSVDTVLESLKRLNVWAPPDASSGRLDINLPTRRVGAAYQLPPGYDHARPHPTLLVIPAQGQSAEKSIAVTAAALGEAVREFVWIALPDNSLDGSFHLSSARAGELRHAVRAIRRQIHTDTDRWFLFGTDTGGDAAWMAAVTHPDLFAGVIVLSSYPWAPYPQQMYPLLLQNLRHVPVLSAWPVPGEFRSDTRIRAVDLHNRAIAALAAKESLPITGVRLNEGSFSRLALPETSFKDILAGSRRAPATSLTNWFRYPGHGRASWLRQTRFSGTVWTDDQLSILPAPGVDRDSFIRRVIRPMMARLSGHIDGQTIRIYTRRCERIELRLPEGLVDFERPVTVFVNDQRRYAGPVEPNIRSLLDSAHHEWEFQRPAVARLSFTVMTDAEDD